MAAGQARRRRRPDVVPCRKRGALGVGAGEQGIEVLAADSVSAPDTRRWQYAVLNPIADRLRGHLKLRGNL